LNVTPNESPDASAIPEHLTDLGNAEYLIARYGHDIRFAPGQGFLTWSGKRWIRDVESVQVEHLAQRSLRALYRAAYDEPDNDRRGRIAKHAAASESASRILAMVRLARSQPEVAIAGDAFDCDRFLLNVANGTLDLRTGELRPHRRQDLITKASPVAYEPDAQCQVFLEFLERIFDGNQSLIDFMRRAFGYALTGDVSERVIFFLYGRGRNGKTTLIRIIMYLLGDYASQAAPGVLMAKKFDAHPAEIADLAGARFVAAIESDEGRWLAEANVKHMTGNDRMKARFMRENWFEFDPTHKIFLATNHKPIVRGTDPAIWDRIRLVPFTVRIPEEEEDHYLQDKLRTEASGILAWAVRGAQEWFRDGLGTPPEVRAATAAYREEMDVLGDFLAERCVVSPSEFTRMANLYTAYSNWSTQSGEHPLSKKAFGSRLDERGFRPRRGTGGTAIRIGLRLLEANNRDESDE
jgi:putative DNA primase/helicase